MSSSYIQEPVAVLAILLGLLAGLFWAANQPAGQRLFRFVPLLLLALQWALKAPTFFMAVGSQANIGGAASAPIVASAFHPALSLR